MTNSPESSSSLTPSTGPTEHDDSGVSPSLAPLLQLRAITKSFGAVQALKYVDLDVPAGKVTALIGDNGAGKSTLIKAIAGIYTPTSGEILWNGKVVHIHTPRDAEHLGIATVYQDLALCDNLDVVQNMFLGHEEMRYRTLDEITMELAAKQVLADLSVTTVKSVRQKVASLSGGQRQSVAVAKAVMRESKLVILDEPTAALGVSQTAQVLELIHTLAGRGIAVLVISHNLNDVFAVADRIAVMHLGTLVSSGPVADYDASSAVDLITTGESARNVSPMAPSS
ncbi:MAG TPA: ATP-binding cassette domain-containing protein [Acidimicrobiales bacterium]|nr:ATP-binding cassette domain-containing protein [Acidimicrobiales bacterium]